MIRSVDDGFAYLESFVNLERATYKPRIWRISRMRKLLNDFGNPQLRYKTLHVAGSKGKGSTSVYAASILNAAGFKTGLYTSPHIMSYRERVQLFGVVYGDDLLIEQFQKIKRYVDGPRAETPKEQLPTTFELLTLFAFLVFDAAGCEVAVIEVGLGGRLDATSLLKPECTMITPIELEHTEYLGNTLRSIAAEKAAIIRETKPVFVADQHEEARATIERIAFMRGAPVVHVSECDPIRAAITKEGTHASFQIPGGLSITANLRMLGEVQARNAALAALAVTHCFQECGIDDITRGLERAWLPGRSELIRGGPTLLLDGAHTERSIALLCRTAAQIAPSRRNRAAIFGAVLGKSHEPMLRLLVESFSRIIICKPGTFKPSDPEQLYQACKEQGGNCSRIDDAPAAIAGAREAVAHDDGLVAVVGSFFLVAKIRRELDREAVVINREDAKSNVTESRGD